MNESELSERLKSLTAEFKASGMDIDSFLRQKLCAVKSDGAQSAEAIIQTLAEIDANYADLQQAKENGLNRRDWLGKKISEAAKEAGADDKPELVGEALAAVINAMNGKDAESAMPVPFEGVDAVETVDALDAALRKSAVSGLSK